MTPRGNGRVRQQGAAPREQQPGLQATPWPTEDAKQIDSPCGDLSSRGSNTPIRGVRLTPIFPRQHDLTDRYVNLMLLGLD